MHGRPGLKRMRFILYIDIIIFNDYLLNHYYLLNLEYWWAL